MEVQFIPTSLVPPQAIALSKVSVIHGTLISPSDPITVSLHSEIQSYILEVSHDR